MELVVIGKKLDPRGSQELQYGLEQLLRRLPGTARREVTQAQDWHSLLAVARTLADAAALPDEARILLLGHAHLMLAPGCLEALAAALDRGASAAQGHDSAHPHAQHPPDYCTVRGMERYVQDMAAVPAVRGAADDGSALLTLTTAGALRRGNWQTTAVRVGQAFAHDFSGYHQGRREEVIPLVPAAARSVLDVGGGEGGFLQALKASLGCETHLAEYSTDACATAASRVDRVWPGDFHATDFGRLFDCITFLDVLEHTVSPLQWLQRARRLLNAGGSVVTSIPNVGHWSVVADLLEGRWDYAPAGIHCITHLRFFTRHGIEDLMTEAGLRIVELQATRIEPPAWFDTSSLARTLRLDADSLASYAFLLRAEPC